MGEHIREIKASEYKIYRDLKYQEMINPKNKFDNRLYFSHRFKNLTYQSERLDELFKQNYNREVWRIFVSL